MKKVLVVTITLSICVIILLTISGCSFKEANPTPIPDQTPVQIQSFISNPDQIILYKDSKPIQLDKGNKDYAEIVRLTNERFSNKISVVKDIVDNAYVNGLKKRKESLGLEFVYSQEQTMKIKGNDSASFKYNRLFFLLVDNVLSSAQPSIKTEFLQYGDLTNYKDSSRGPLASSKNLIDLVLKIQ